MTRIDCTEVRDLIQAYEDDELPASERTAVAKHLQTCADCSKALADLQRLRSTIRAGGTFAPPPGFEERIRATIGLEDRHRLELDWRRFARLAASHVVALALGAVLAYGALARNDARTSTARDLVTAHVRSLIGEQLVQVASSNTHTVKPWFVGRIPYSPDVKELSAKDYALIGGRLDYVLDRPTAALVYGRREHRINLFIQPIDYTARADEFSATRNGYNIAAWTSGEFNYFATSDLNAAELAEFARVFRNN